MIAHVVAALRRHTQLLVLTCGLALLASTHVFAAVSPSPDKRISPLPLYHGRRDGVFDTSQRWYPKSESVASSLLVTLRGGGSPRQRQSQQRFSKRTSATRFKRKSSGPSSSSSSMTASIFNLVNNVAGAGLLALASGQAAGTGYVPAVLVACFLGAVSARTFVMIGQACELTKEKDFKGLWSRTLGANTTWVVDSVISLLCLACAVIYSGILGDVFTPLLAPFVPSRYNHRGTNILALTMAALFPMSLLKNLSALAFTSLLGFASILYTVLFISIRALDGTYTLGSGKFVTDGVLKALPAFDRTSMTKFDFTSLVLISNYGLAYVAHYNGPTFYRELEDTNSKRFSLMVAAAFGALILLYITTMLAGYSTFGDSCKGNILLNYHPDDLLSTFGRLATGCSILFGFPLVVAGAREGLINCASSLGWNEWGSDKNHVLLVTAILAFVTFVSVAVKDVSVVVGLTGAAMGSAIVYICPALVYTRAVKLVKGSDSAAYRSARWNLAMVPGGIAIAALGVYMTLKES